MIELAGYSPTPTFTVEVTSSWRTSVADLEGFREFASAPFETKFSHLWIFVQYLGKIKKMNPTL